jgi:STE24 endopeptidase
VCLRRLGSGWRWRRSPRCLVGRCPASWIRRRYAAGAHSVAVTSRVVEDYRTGRLSEPQVVAVLVHELGHHATGATRPMLIAMWLAAPWRVAARLLTGLGSALSGRQPQQGLAVVGVLGVVVAVVRSVHQGHSLDGGLVAAVALAAVM